MTNPSPQRLSLPRVLAFSTLSIPIAALSLPLSVHLAPLYANELGVGLELTGLIFMLVRLWDLVADPFIGYYIDRYRSPLGRVRHWILISIPILAISTWFIYLPPREGVTPTYFALCLSGLYLGYSVLTIARGAWVPAIAPTYDERSRLFVWPEVFSVLAMIGILAVPAILEASGIKMDRIGQVAVMGTILLLSLPLSALLSCLFVPDPPMSGTAATHESYSFASVMQALRNPYLLRIMLVDILTGLAIAVTAANYLFVAEYVFGLSDGAASLILVVFFLLAVLALPFWQRLANRTEKTSTVILAVLVSAASYLLYYAGAQVGGFWGLVPGAILNGIGFTAPIVLLRSMTADVIELQAEQTGHDRSGLYYSLISASYKIGSSLAIGVGYFILARVVGFNPRVENTPEAIHGLLLVFCLMPTVLYLVSAWLLRGYPLTRAHQIETAARLAARNSV